MLQVSDVEGDTIFFWNVGRISRDPVFPDFVASATVPTLPTSVDFIDVKLSRISPSHYVLCFEIGLNPTVTEELLDKLGDAYTGQVQWYEAERLRGSIGIKSPEVQRKEELANHVNAIEREIERLLKPSLRGGYFNEFPHSRLGRLDIISLKGLPELHGAQSAAWQAAAREWCSPLGLSWMQGFNWDDAAVIPRELHFGSEYPWRLLVRPEAFSRVEAHEDPRAEILRTVGNLIGGLASVVALDRFAVIQQYLVAAFRKSVFKVARNKLGAYFQFWRHSGIQQQILTSRVLVQAPLAGLTRSRSRLLWERYVGNAFLLNGSAGAKIQTPDPFISSMEQRFAFIAEDMDRAASFLNAILSARNLVATYVLTFALLLVTIVAMVGFDNLRHWVSLEVSPVRGTVASNDQHAHPGQAIQNSEHLR